jgi:hypothetical protein
MDLSQKPSQPNWDPAAARARFGLTLSDAERTAIQAKLPTSPMPGVFYYYSAKSSPSDTEAVR